MLRCCQRSRVRVFCAMCALDSPLRTSGCQLGAYLATRATSVGSFASTLSSPNTFPLVFPYSSETEIGSESVREPKVQIDRLLFCLLSGSLLGRMLVPDLSFISARWTESELRERGGERKRWGRARCWQIPTLIGQKQGLQSLTRKEILERDDRMKKGARVWMAWCCCWWEDIVRRVEFFCNHRQKS